MKLAKEGYLIVAIGLSITVLLTAVLFFLVPATGMPIWLFPVIAVLLWGLFAGVLMFFREPTKRPLNKDPELVYSSADGKVVVIEEVFEEEFFKQTCIQVSVFMSVSNVHVNWYPVGGKVIYKKYHSGKFLVAWKPKSSKENERTTTVIENQNGKVLFRQIAGFVARRIVNYTELGDEAEQNTKYGFIKFGSRIDILLPLGSEILVELGDKVKGGQTPIARLKT